MAPFFYIPFLADASVIELDADTSHHIAQVLRMQVGEPLYLTDGNGLKLYGQLTSVTKRSCVVQVAQRTVEPFSGRNVHLTVAPIKNNSRFEWLIEKATELGVRSIRPILTARTEKQRLRIDRLKQISDFDFRSPNGDEVVPTSTIDRALYRCRTNRSFSVGFVG
jgi:16S rRNA (uracil1498-N3)-methyltransferase